MYLILLLIVFLVLGFFLSRSRFSNSIDGSTKKAANTTRVLAVRNKNWWSARFGRRRGNHSFIEWVNGRGGKYLPGEFTSWFFTLSERQTENFVSTLADYMLGLGFELRKLSDGSLDNKPALLQIYVEAVVIYSNAYRKAKEAQKEAEKNTKKSPSNGSQPEEQDEIPLVEIPEMAEPVPAG